MPAPAYRSITTPADPHVAWVVIGGIVLIIVTLILSAQGPPRDADGVVRWDGLGVPAVLWLLWVWGLLTLVFRPGPTLADGRVGIARRVFGRTWWQSSRHAAGVQRLVVRHEAGRPTAELVAWYDDDALPLMKLRPVGEVRATANGLAAALGVPVADENAAFTGTRTEQPVYSGVEVNGETLTLPGVNVERERPVREVRAFGPEFRDNLKLYLPGLASAAFMLLMAALWIGGTLWSAGQLVFVGQTSTTVGPFDLRGGNPPPPLGVRLGTAGGAVLFALSVGGGFGFAAWWIGRVVWKDMKRTSAAVAVWRTDTTRRTGVTLTFTLAPDALVVAGVGVEPVRWAWADVREARAHREEGEEGHHEWLELRHARREVWRVRCLPDGDSEYLATRIRTAARLPDPPPPASG